MRLSFAALIALALSGTGCGPDCQSSCDKIFADQADACGIAVPGKEASEMISECVAHCESALKRNGDVGDYDPDERASGDDDISLENEKQAALWMDCVAETSCDNLNKNYCAPVKNFPN